MVHFNDILKAGQDEYSAIDAGNNFADKCDEPGTYVVELLVVKMKEIKGEWKILWEGKILEGNHAKEQIPTIFTGIEGRNLEFTKKFLSRIDAMPEKATDIPNVIEGLKGLIVEVDITRSSTGHSNAYIKKLVNISASDASGIQAQGEDAGPESVEDTGPAEAGPQEESNPMEEKIAEPLVDQVADENEDPF